VGRLDISCLTISSNSCKGPEVVRYKHFVNAGNTVLSMLKSVKHTGMHDSNEPLGILFYRNDPQLLEGTHGHPYPFKTSRKPDVVIVSLQAAKRVLDLEGENIDWDGIARDAAITDPPCTFKTYEVILCNEEKYRKEINPDSLNLSDLPKMPPPVVGGNIRPAAH